MNIGEVAAASGVSAKMIRYYESIALIPPVGRSAGGYRVYQAPDIDTLRFIHSARRVGFPVERIRRLLALWRDKGRASADVKSLAAAHIADLDRQIGDLQAMRRSLEHLAARCHGDDRPDCPILDGLADPVPLGRVG
ncbi:MAG TPA: Cu(I)-responsive transcriptional regulator [Stellaceae bacterium]|nr:Cu(I)-responsive transcriptional regulator [Stellaceae bacterium]